MWPIVVDTAFTSGAVTIGPEVSTGKPEAISLLPINWDVKWSIQRGLGGNGLSDLVKAQKIPVPTAGDVLLLKSAQTLVRSGSESWNGAPLSGNVITRSIGAYTSGFGKIGITGSVNFKL
jgi:hypothetical protein